MRVAARVGIASVVLFAALVARAERPEAAVPNAPATPIRGSLVLAGGGTLPERVFDEFLKLAGGEKARIVVIPTASAEADAYQTDATKADELLARWRDRKPADVRLLHARSRDEANRADFVKPLGEATGVWFGGGDQARIAAAYRGTAVERALRALLERDGVIGGTSAGAAVMSRVMIADGDAEHLKISTGFDFVPGAIVDQHFLARRREPRLRVALARHPGRVGLGIDEATALVVRGRTLRVVGDSTVTVMLPASATRPPLEKRLDEKTPEDLVALSRAALARAGEPFPPARPKSPRVASGALVIVGGGRMPEGVLKKFIELAGGPQAKIVVVPTASERPSVDTGEKRMFAKAGCTNVVVLHAKSRAEADSPELAKTLADARGLWFGGGRQWRFVDAYEGTKCYDAFHDVLRRGGVVGGSSAGATIQGDYLVRGSPLGNTIMMAEGYERGFAFLPGSAIDQHFTQRKRGPDLEGVVRTYPQLLCLGIDEATAVVVRGTRCEVLGEHTVSIYPPRRTGDEDSSADDVPPPQVLKAGEAYDLEQFAPTK